jgi:outer membrane protein assembly factor BamE (lipoprotein component of BamABCDE complex)
MVTVVFTLLAGCATPPPSSSAAGGKTAAVAPATEPAGPESALKRGMTPEEVKAIMGEPAEIKPMKSPAGAAEIWVYLRRSQGRTQQIMVGTKSTPMMTTNSNGDLVTTQTIEEPILRQQIEIIDETVSLLIFEGRYTEQNRTIQKHLEFQ